MKLEMVAGSWKVERLACDASWGLMNARASEQRTKKGCVFEMFCLRADAKRFVRAPPRKFARRFAFEGKII